MVWVARDVGVQASVLAPDVLGRLLGGVRPVPAATLEKALGTLRGVGDLEKIFGHICLHELETIKEGKVRRS